ncbi:uridylyl transferase [Fischerella thermalis CCMEE 5268]|uniref:Uridylyl transferase n=1 Tax=Fischerella thermalis CCMEE 5268 TaxID=2019662 RepID=A0A2N6KML8_9CYAN|nr:uridylyl transferase [Fischerella thermalis CCMEE 5268]
MVHWEMVSKIFGFRFGATVPLGGSLRLSLWRDLRLVPRDLSRGLDVARNYQLQD